MTDSIHAIPLDRIDEDALPRDRTRLDPTALSELTTSIATTGLRQPIEVFATDTGYGLISGLRRLTAFRQLAGSRPDDFATIPAFLRDPGTLETALTRMVEENDIRADISPWDQARMVIEAWRAGLYDTPDAALAGLYPNANRQRRARIRSVAVVVEEFEGTLIDPDHLTQRQLLRLAAACREGFIEVLTHALTECGAATAPAQWRLLETVLAEAEADARSPEHSPRPGRPRRVARIRTTLSIRRERTPEGWVLRFTGQDASGALMEDIMDEIERLVGR